MEVSLPDGLVEVIDGWVRDGAYGSRTDVLSEALLLLADRDADRERAREAVRAKVVEGIEAIEAGDVHPGERIFDELVS